MSRSRARTATAGLFTLIFVCGFTLMGFEMLGSRYLNPWFGSGISSWACLISVVLLAMMAGYAVGGRLADRSQDLRGVSVALSVTSLWMFLTAMFGHEVLEAVMIRIGHGFFGVMIAAAGLTFLPVAILAGLSPFFVRVLLHDLRHGGRITGAVYGVSTMGNVAGTLLTVFVLIPRFGTTDITVLFALILLGAAITILAMTGYGAARASEPAQTSS